MFCGSAQTGIQNRNFKFPLGNRRSTVENQTVTVRLPASHGDTPLKAIMPSLMTYLTLWLALIVAGREKLFHDDDTYWHIAVGREILQSGEFVTTDSYSCTRPGELWIAHQWLGECGLALMDRAAGWDGLLLSTTAALAAVYAWIVSRLLAAGLHGLVATLWIMIAIAASTHNFLIRPHMATLVLLGVVFGILTAVDHRRVGLSQLWWFVPMMLVWSNTHGGVIGGLGHYRRRVCRLDAVLLVRANQPSPKPERCAVVILRRHAVVCHDNRDSLRNGNHYRLAENSVG